MKLVVFSAPWCGPCSQQKKHLAKYKEAFPDTVLEPVDIEKASSTELVTKYEVKSLPALVLVDDEGKMLKKHAGTALSFEKLVEFMKV